MVIRSRSRSRSRQKSIPPMYAQSLALSALYYVLWTRDPGFFTWFRKRKPNAKNQFSHHYTSGVCIVEFIVMKSANSRTRIIYCAMNK